MFDSYVVFEVLAFTPRTGCKATDMNVERLERNDPPRI